MSKIRTGTELQQWLDEQRLKRQIRKEREQKRLEKEKQEKAEARKKREERILRKQKPVLQHNIYAEQKTMLKLKIYGTHRTVGKFSSDSDLFQTWEEIKNAENDEKENGRLNWTYLPTLIEEAKKLLKKL